MTDTAAPDTCRGGHRCERMSTMTHEELIDGIARFPEARASVLPSWDQAAEALRAVGTAGPSLSAFFAAQADKADDAPEEG